MKREFFLKLARSNISKNRRFFLPRILSEAGLLCVFYIVFTLRADERILQLRGGQFIELFMSIGVAVMMLLPALLKTKLDVSEMVCSLMLNYIVMYLIKYLMNTYLADKTKGQIQSYEFLETS